MSTNPDWLKKDGHGRFVHGGVHAVAGRGEWVRNRERIP